MVPGGTLIPITAIPLHQGLMQHLTLFAIIGGADIPIVQHLGLARDALACDATITLGAIVRIVIAGGAIHHRCIVTGGDAFIVADAVIEGTGIQICTGLRSTHAFQAVLGTIGIRRNITGLTRVAEGAASAIIARVTFEPSGTNNPFTWSADTHLARI